MKSKKIKVKYMSGVLRDVELSDEPLNKQVGNFCARGNKWVVPGMPSPLNPSLYNPWFKEDEIIYEVPEAAKMLFIKDADNGKILHFNVKSISEVDGIKEMIKNKGGYQDCEITLKVPKGGAELEGSLTVNSNALIDLIAIKKEEVAPVPVIEEPIVELEVEGTEPQPLLTCSKDDKACEIDPPKESSAYNQEYLAYGSALGAALGLIGYCAMALRSNKNMSTSIASRLLEEFSPKVCIGVALVGAMIGAGVAYISSGQSK